MQKHTFDFKGNLRKDQVAALEIELFAV